MALKTIRAVVLAALLPALVACAAGGAPSATEDVVAAVIVKPKQPSGAESLVQAMQAMVGETARVRYVRPLAGDAHLIHLARPATREQVPGLIGRLRASGAFQYVELDSPMKTQ